VVRVAAVWTVLSGSMLLLLCVSHLDVIGDHLGRTNSGGRAAASAGLLALCGLTGLAMLYSGVLLWRFRETGRRVTLWIAGGMSMLMISAVAVDASAPVIAPLVMSAVIVAVLVSRPARELCRSAERAHGRGASIT
jgi:hypothetical protein